MRLDRLKKKFNRKSSFVVLNYFYKCDFKYYHLICPNCKNPFAKYSVLKGEDDKDDKSYLYVVCDKCFMVYRLKKHKKVKR